MSETNDIRKIDLQNDFMVTAVCGSKLAGDMNGSAFEALFKMPRHLAVGPDGCVYVADRYNNAIRMISRSGNNVRTLAGLGVNEVCC